MQPIARKDLAGWKSGNLFGFLVMLSLSSFRCSDPAPAEGNQECKSQPYIFAPIESEAFYYNPLSESPRLMIRLYQCGYQLAFFISMQGGSFDLTGDYCLHDDVPVRVDGFEIEDIASEKCGLNNLGPTVQIYSSDSTSSGLDGVVKVEKYEVDDSQAKPILFRGKFGPITLVSKEIIGSEGRTGANLPCGLQIPSFDFEVTNFRPDGCED